MEKKEMIFIRNSSLGNFWLYVYGTVTINFFLISTSDIILEQGKNRDEKIKMIEKMLKNEKNN